jgi:hypothetical protein
MDESEWRERGKKEKKEKKMKKKRVCFVLRSLDRAAARDLYFRAIEPLDGPTHHVTPSLTIESALSLSFQSNNAQDEDVEMDSSTN